MRHITAENNLAIKHTNMLAEISFDNAESTTHGIREYGQWKRSNTQFTYPCMWSSCSHEIRFLSEHLTISIFFSPEKTVE